MNEAALVAAVSIVTEVFKRAGFPNRYLPVVALVCGVALGWFILDGGTPPNSIVQGVLIGGAAMGLYRGTKVVIRGW